MNEVDVESGTRSPPGPYQRKGGTGSTTSEEESTDMDRERPTFFERISMVGGIIGGGGKDAGTARMSLVDRVSNAIMPGPIKRVDPILVDRDAALNMNVRPSLIGGNYNMRPSFSLNGQHYSSMMTVNPKDIACQGFIVMNVAPPSTISLLKQKHKWDRRYVILNFGSQLFYYANKSDYKTNPHSHLNPRPLILDEFYVSTTDSGDNSSNVDKENRFWFSLIPKEDDRYRNWQYRTDTEEELDMWLTAMRQVSPSSFR